MSLATNVYDAVVRVATELKAHRTLINGNQPDLSGLSTTAKASLVAAINEVAAAVATASGIDDSTTSTSKGWSSSKVRGEIDSAASAATAAAISDSGTSTSKAWSSSNTANKIAAAVAAMIDDAASSPTKTYSSAQVESKLAALKDSILGGAGAAYDTLGELQALLTNSGDAITALNTALANRVRFDGAQSLTAPQQQQARDNIGGASAASVTALSTAVGNTETNFVTAFEAALV